MRITEVYPFQPGASTDFQLMGEPGPHSSFIEIYTSQATDLEGYKIIVDGCTLALPRFSRIWHYKALFVTDFRDKDGKPCRGFPSSGVVYLYDPAGKLIDERTYSQPEVGESWAPMDATNADSPWASRVPSPGRNLREASFPAKPPGTQEGITSDVATTQLLMSDTVTIREYLNAAYGDEELTAFCFDHFRPAYDSFAAGMTRGHKIQILLEYCERHDAIPQLLSKLERDRPNQFGAQFAAYATTSALHTPRTPVGNLTGRAESTGHVPQTTPPAMWDVFISHASEDKETLARPLAQALEARGLRVWFDEFTLSVGDRLRRSIDHGLANCHYGIVILSPMFFAKEWPQKELDGLTQREERGEKVILPVWHNIAVEQIRAYSPTLADRLGVLSNRGLDQVVAELLRAMGTEPTVERSIEHYSCYISYSFKDQAFADRLHADLQAKGVRCWFAPEDLKIGERIWERLDQSIRLHDKLLVILSEHSVGSDWVKDEVMIAFEEERKRHKTVLFPVRLDDAVMASGEAWAGLVRQRHIGDFRAWKEHDAYREGFERLMRDLKAGEDETGQPRNQA